MAIHVALVNGFLAISPTHDVINGARVLDSQQATNESTPLCRIQPGLEQKPREKRKPLRLAKLCQRR